MKKIILSEKGEQILLQHLVEEVVYEGDKENLIIQWLNKAYKPCPQKTTPSQRVCNPQSYGQLVFELDDNKQITDNVKTLQQVLDILETKYKTILHDKDARNNLLSKTLNKWYTNYK